MYAGFWKRFAAFIIDSVILNIVNYTIMTVSGTNPNTFSQDVYATMGPAMLAKMLGVMGLTTVIYFVYFAAFESSSLMATPGKLALGIKVVDMNGQRLSFWRSLGRNLGKIISSLTLNIAYVMAGFTVRKQALHDKMANALVINASALGETEFPPLPKTSAGMVFLAILGALAPFIIVVCLIAMVVFFIVGQMGNMNLNRGGRPQECSNGVCSATGNGPILNLSSDKKDILNKQGDLLTLIAHFQNKYTDEHGGIRASSFTELEDGVDGFPKGQDKIGNAELALSGSYVTLTVPDTEDSAGYVITKCYAQNYKTCIQSKDFDIVVGSGWEYAAPDNCCF